MSTGLPKRNNTHPILFHFSPTLVAEEGVRDKKVTYRKCLRIDFNESLDFGSLGEAAEAASSRLAAANLPCLTAICCVRWRTYNPRRFCGLQQRHPFPVVGNYGTAPKQFLTKSPTACPNTRWESGCRVSASTCCSLSI